MCEENCAYGGYSDLLNKDIFKRFRKRVELYQ